MKKIICAFLSIFLITPCMANIHIKPEIVVETIATHFPTKQKECIREYNAQLKASNGAGIAASKLWNVCAAGGLDIKKTTDKEKCRAFVQELQDNSIVYLKAVCGKDKNITGGECIKQFSAISVTKLQAQGLAKLFVRVKYNDNSITCGTKPRIESQTVGSINPHAIGMSSTVKIPYVQCTSLSKNKFYEFRFSNVDGTNDKKNLKNFMGGICGIFGSKYKDYKTTENRVDVRYDVCEDIKTQQDCEKINVVLEGSDLGVHSMWYGGDYQYAVHYCVLREYNVFHSPSKELDGISIESTAFGLDNRVFLKAGISRKGSKEIKAQIRTYVENSIGKENVKSFKCEDNYHSGKLQDTHKKADMLVCYVNGEEITFMFNDLSTVWGTYDKSGREAMNCVAWGGTFTGKKCIGLDEQQCYKVRDANAASCPECKLIKWEDNICKLPSSVDATNLKRGLTYSAIVGGAVVTVVVTVGTLGTGTAPTAVILAGAAVELTGSVIELTAQQAIYEKTDKFFDEANKCNNQTCAEKIIKEYLQALSNQKNDMTDAEINAADTIFAQMFDKIPSDSKFYQDIIEQGIKGKTLETNKRGHFDVKSWNPEQIWRAVGIALQIVPTLVSVGWRIAEKSDKFVKSTAKLQSKLNDALKIKPENNFDVSARIDDLMARYKRQFNQLDALKSQYNINDNITDEEIYKILNQHPDIAKILDDITQTHNELQKLRYENPGLWKPGEDVADYYDVDALINKLKSIRDEDMGYIASLKQREKEIRAQVGTDYGKDEARTLETNKEIAQLQIERNNILKEYNDALEDLSDQRMRLELGRSEQELELMPEYQQIRTEMGRVEEAKRNIENTNPRIIEIDKKIDELGAVYKPEAVDLINEQNYINELIRDAELTIGDKQNVAWWNAIPAELKEKYIEYKDDQIIKLLAQDDELSLYVNRFDEIRGKPEELKKFFKIVEQKLNTAFPENNQISINTFYNPNTGLEAHINGAGDVEFNTAKLKNLEDYVGNIKHEILGHHVDNVMPNYGLQGETMLNEIPNFNANRLDKNNIASHYTETIISGRSPLTNEDFDLTGISEEAVEKLRQEGWKINETISADEYYNGYRKVITEQEAWSITPTSDVKNKVNSMRREMGLKDLSQ